MNTETLLLISIFQEAYPLGSMRVRPEEYLDHFGFDIDRIGRVLKYLGLAQDGRSELCWTATPMLMKIIAERVAHPPVKAKRVEVSEDDRSSVWSLIRYATGDYSGHDGDYPDYDDLEETGFCCSVLVALGLLTEDGEHKPTDRLHEVMRQAPLQRTPEAARGSQ